MLSYLIMVYLISFSFSLSFSFFFSLYFSFSLSSPSSSSSLLFFYLLFTLLLCSSFLLHYLIFSSLLFSLLFSSRILSYLIFIFLLVRFCFLSLCIFSVLFSPLLFSILSKTFRKYNNGNTGRCLTANTLILQGESYLWIRLRNAWYWILSGDQVISLSRYWKRTVSLSDQRYRRTFSVVCLTLFPYPRQKQTHWKKIKAMESSGLRVYGVGNKMCACVCVYICSGCVIPTMISCLMISFYTVGVYAAYDTELNISQPWETGSEWYGF